MKTRKHIASGAVRASAADLAAALSEVAAGRDTSLQNLMSLVYEELRSLAAAHLRAERPDHTLQPTALVHELYLRLLKQRERHWLNDGEFFQVAAQMMRRVLIDHARGHGRAKRGCQWQRISLDATTLFCSDRASELLALDESLSRLMMEYPRAAHVVELRFYGGLSVEEAANVLNTSPKTVKRDWSFARSWLYGDLRSTYGFDPLTARNGKKAV